MHEWSKIIAVFSTPVKKGHLAFFPAEKAEPLLKKFRK
jgi:hypothetical protein